MKSKVDQLFEQLEKEGKVIHLTDEELLAIDKHIEDDMKEFREEMYRRDSIQVRPVIINA